MSHDWLTAPAARDIARVLNKPLVVTYHDEISGKSLGVNVNTGKINKVISFSYTDPYYTVDGVSQGFDVYKRKTNASNLSVGPYSTDALGGGVKFGYPISEKVSVNFGINAETVKLQTFDNSPQQYINFVNTFGNDYRYGALTAG